MSRRTQHPPEDRVMPIGFQKGTKLRHLSDRDLRKTRQWCTAHDAPRWRDLIDDIDHVLAGRQGEPLGL